MPPPRACPVGVRPEAARLVLGAPAARHPRGDQHSVDIIVLRAHRRLLFSRSAKYLARCSSRSAPRREVRPPSGRRPRYVVGRAVEIAPTAASLPFGYLHVVRDAHTHRSRFGASAPAPPFSVLPRRYRKSTDARGTPARRRCCRIAAWPRARRRPARAAADRPSCTLVGAGCFLQAGAQLAALRQPFLPPQHCRGHGTRPAVFVLVEHAWAPPPPARAPWRPSAAARQLGQPSPARARRPSVIPRRARDRARRRAVGIAEPRHDRRGCDNPGGSSLGGRRPARFEAPPRRRQLCDPAYSACTSAHRRASHRRGRTLGDDVAGALAGRRGSLPAAAPSPPLAAAVNRLNRTSMEDNIVRVAACRRAA